MCVCACGGELPSPLPLYASVSMEHYLHFARPVPVLVDGADGWCEGEPRRMRERSMGVMSNENKHISDCVALQPSCGVPL